MSTLDAGAIPDFEDLDDYLVGSPFSVDVAIGANTFKGIIDADSVDGDSLGGPIIHCKSSDVRVQSITHGSSLVVEGRTYRVEGLQPDGTGWHQLIMTKTS